MDRLIMIRSEEDRTYLEIQMALRLKLMVGLLGLLGATMTLHAQELPEATKPTKVAKQPKLNVTEHNAQVIEGIKAQPKTFKWEGIVIHHTASEYSSVARIDAYHRTKFNDPDGIEYHFLLGNGKKRPVGYIELGRWRIQKLAIHLFKPQGAPNAIAISLVGNMHERKIQPAQYEALLELTQTLMDKYEIPIEKITTHTRVDGRLTVCPGKHFPYERFINELKARQAVR